MAEVRVHKCLRHARDPHYEIPRGVLGPLPRHRCVLFNKWVKANDCNLQAIVEYEECCQRLEYSTASIICHDWDCVMGALRNVTGVFSRGGRYFQSRGRFPRPRIRRRKRKRSRTPLTKTLFSSQTTGAPMEERVCSSLLTSESASDVKVCKGVSRLCLFYNSLFFVFYWGKLWRLKETCWRRSGQRHRSRIHAQCCCCNCFCCRARRQLLPRRS